MRIELNKEEEINRLKKELNRFETFLEKLYAKFTQDGYSEKCPENIKKIDSKKYIDTLDKIANIQDRLLKLR